MSLVPLEGRSIALPQIKRCHASRKEFHMPQQPGVAGIDSGFFEQLIEAKRHGQLSAKSPRNC
jgi:hypothetical protein